MPILLILLTTQLCAIYISAMAIPPVVSAATNSTFKITKPASSFDSALSITQLPDVPIGPSQAEHSAVRIDNAPEEVKRRTGAGNRKSGKSVKMPMGGMQCTVM
jgi:hypothetical protein